MTGQEVKTFQDLQLPETCHRRHDTLDTISLVVDSFPSWTPMWGMIPSYFLDSFAGNFLVKKFEGGVDGMTWGKHGNIESFQGSITSFQGVIIWSRARKIEEETHRDKFGRV
ncbi:hypothetical protein M9H77_03369 [Catharanthus roseus]|uniref:Uncharacterized protein n=1 Tax=Catharanthus roseus TaxID=4058 RepID=A0ACC0CB45_CATRO|nr:hypothetical protein M9H77_03369 [Catharanthus roseus]